MKPGLSLFLLRVLRTSMAKITLAISSMLAMPTCCNSMAITMVPTISRVKNSEKIIMSGFLLSLPIIVPLLSFLGLKQYTDVPLMLWGVLLNFVIIRVVL